MVHVDERRVHCAQRMGVSIIRNHTSTDCNKQETQSEQIQTPATAHIGHLSVTGLPEFSARQERSYDPTTSSIFTRI